MSDDAVESPDLWFMLLETFRHCFRRTDDTPVRCAELYRRYGLRLTRSQRTQLGTEIADAARVMAVGLASGPDGSHRYANLAKAHGAWKRLADEILVSTL